MAIPRFWKLASKEIKAPEGKIFKLSSWGWSQNSADEARNLAESRLSELASRIISSSAPPDEYPYPRTPLREEIIEELRSNGDEFDVITRNRYGASVLNTSSVYFADIDINQSQGGTVFNKLRKFFGRKPSAKDALTSVDDALEKLDKYLTLNRSWGFRVYKTFAGLRYIATHARVPISESGIVESLVTLGSDPKYILLCKIQKCYRARLSPKPWRCGLSSFSIRYPFQNISEENVFKNWENKYQNTSKDYATCQYIKTVGLSDISSDVSQIITIHDEKTRALSGLPLA